MYLMLKQMYHEKDCKIHKCNHGIVCQTDDMQNNMNLQNKNSFTKRIFRRFFCKPTERK